MGWKAAGATRIQFDEPNLLMNLDSHQPQAFTHECSELESLVPRLSVLIHAYFADVPAEAHKKLSSLKGVTVNKMPIQCPTAELFLIQNSRVNSVL